MTSSTTAKNADGFRHPLFHLVKGIHRRLDKKGYWKAEEGHLVADPDNPFKEKDNTTKGDEKPVTHEQLLQSIQDPLDRQHAQETMDRILDDKNQWEIYCNLQQAPSQYSNLEDSRKECLARMEHLATSEERLDSLRKELQPISRQVAQIQKMAHADREDALCRLTSIRMNEEILQELVVGLDDNPQNMALFQAWRKHHLEDLETKEQKTALVQYDLVQSDPTQFGSSNKSEELCDTCGWNIGVSDPRWRCMICREVQCDACHGYFHQTFHGDCCGQSLGVVCEYLHPSMRHFEARACPTLAQALFTTLQGHANRPCFCPWDTKEWLTYRQVLQAVLQRVTKLHQHKEDITHVLLCFPTGSMEFYFWDMACIMVGITTIGLHAPPPPKEDWPTLASHLVCPEQDRQKYAGDIPSCLIWLDPVLEEGVPPFDARELFHSNPQPDQDDEAVWTYYYTSGTTGKPKLIPETRKTFREDYVDSFSSRASKPQCTVSYLPHCWGTDRGTVYWNLIRGNRLGFAPSNPTMPQIVEAMEFFQPTTMTLPPAVAHFLLALPDKEDGKPPSDLGGRLEYVSVGSGPVPQTMPDELSRRYGIADVREGYGTTEVGGIASNGYFYMDVVHKVRLRDPNDQEKWLDKRKEGVVGELWIGNVNTCDIVELKNKGRQVRVIGRSSNAATFKLPNGKWCALIDIENEIARACCPDMFDEVMTWCNQKGMLVLLGTRLTPRTEKCTDTLLEEALARTKLSSEMRPKVLLLSGKPLPKTITMKIQRGKVISDFQNAADRCEPDGEGPATQKATQQEDAPANDTTTRNVATIAAWILGGPVDPTKSFLENGGDSMLAIQLLQQVKKEMGEGAVSDWRSLLNNPLQGQAPIEEENAVLTFDPPPAAEELAKCILLTGATGFFGRHVLCEILKREAETTVVCLVRRASKSAIKETERVKVVTEVPPGLKYRLVVHCAADVDHIKGYRALKADNVDLTAELLRLRLAPMIYCSTSSTRQRQPPFVDGYTQSKWVSEQMVLRSGGRCFWPPLLLWGNRRDWLMRIIKHSLRVGRYPFDLGFIEACPVDVASQDLLAGRPCSVWDLDLSELFMRLRVETGMQPTPLASFIAELQTDSESPAYPALPLLLGQDRVGNPRSPSLRILPIDWQSVWPFLRGTWAIS